jgi:hypothetical protein
LRGNDRTLVFLYKTELNLASCKGLIVKEITTLNFAIADRKNQYTGSAEKDGTEQNTVIKHRSKTAREEQ